MPGSAAGVLPNLNRKKGQHLNMKRTTGLFLCCAALAILVIGAGCTQPLPETGSATGFREYNNTTEGIRFETPASWYILKATEPQHPGTVTIRLIQPDGKLMVAFETGDRANLKTGPATPEEWRDQILEGLPVAPYRTDYVLVASEPATLSGSPAWRIEYTALMNNRTPMRGEVFLMMNGTRGTMVTLIGRDDADGVLSEGSQHFIRSISITQ